MICWDRFWSSSSDNKNTAIWDCDDFVTGMSLPNDEEDNKEEEEEEEDEEEDEEEEDGEGRGREKALYSSNGAYDWIVTLHGRGSDGDGEVSATSWTRLLSKTSSSSLSSSFLFGRRYDAFLRDGKYVRTVFNGTCLSGHLLRIGYKQGIINGRYLRDVYLIRSLDSVDERMRL